MSEEIIEVCPWTISVAEIGAAFSDQGESLALVNVCNQERGNMLRFVAKPGEVAGLAGQIMDHVAMIERASIAYCYVAWDKSADDLKAAMVERGALFAPGYGVDVPVIVSKT